MTTSFARRRDAMMVCSRPATSSRGGVLCGCLAFALAWMGGVVDAANAPPDPTQDPVLITAGFLSGHPDLRLRMLALEKHTAGKPEDAFRLFQRAALYADKPSQAMVAEMLWNGTGTAQNRALAYVWMDLAAERGYRGFLLLRERYWRDLTDAERAVALAEGEAVYARYGDTVAEPRLARILRREKRRATGSRTGFVGALTLLVPGPGGWDSIDGSTFYDERYWDPVQYRAWHDSIWMTPKVGSVNVGEVESLRPATAVQDQAQDDP